ncbi:MAG: YdcF family protein [Candidatus Planktophila sp.]|tara:strand:+ start:923 stop:1546 length:624 start_codon:yes stop_codon:yes gene_type:complete
MIFFKLIRRVIAALVLIVISVPLYSLAITWQAANYPLIRNADVIVVLGAAQLDGRPGEVLEARLIEAKRIYELGLASKIITVGAGAPGDRTTEAAASKIWLVSNGIKSINITSLEVGRDTWVSTENYVKFMKIKDMKDVIIVTDPFHCRRSMTMANDLGVVASCSPVQGGPNSLENSGKRYLIREASAYLAYVSLGRRGIHISDHLG